MLLSDGNDNDYNDIEIADGLKSPNKRIQLIFHFTYIWIWGGL